MKYWLFCLAGIAVMGMSFYQGFVRKEVTFRVGSRSMPEGKRTMTGSDAVGLGALGVVAGGAVLILGIVGIRTAASKPYEE